MCHKRLVDYRPSNSLLGRWGSPRHATEPDATQQSILACVAAFERLAREHPTSPLADDAARAAAWWRTEHAALFAAQERQDSGDARRVRARRR
jgi:hypothetical protein